jgi:hypothetical protein
LSFKVRYVLIPLAFLAVVLPGVAHGVWTARWGITEEPQASASRLGELSLSLPEWEGEDATLDPRQLAYTELAGCLSRRYTHRNDGSQLGMLLACGRPGPTVVHTPEICYPGRGYQPVGTLEKKEIALAGLSKAEFYVRIFEKPNPAGEADRIRIYWAWKTAAAHWQAFASPRLKLGFQPVVHKLYVVQPLSGPRAVADKACVDFIRELLPVMDTNLFHSS